MNKKRAGFFFTCLTVLVLSFSLMYAGGDSGIVWLDDYKKTLDKAKEQDRLVMVEFYTSWCQFCGKMEKDTLGDPRVVKMAADFICARLDADVQKAAATRYEPEGYPTVIFATSSGDEIVRVSGFRDADPFVTVMRTVSERGPEIAAHMKTLETDSKNFTARVALAAIFLDLGLGDRAVEHLNAALKAKNLGEADKERVRFQMGRAASVGGDYRKAVKTLKKLIDGDPSGENAPRYYLELGRIYLASGKEDKAREIFTLITEKFPGTPEAEIAAEA